MFLCPKAGVMLKIFAGRFCLSATAEYMFDISGPDWKEKILAIGKPGSVKLPEFKQSGWYLGVSLGYMTNFASSNGGGTKRYSETMEKYQQEHPAEKYRFEEDEE